MRFKGFIKFIINASLAVLLVFFGVFLCKLPGIFIPVGGYTQQNYVRDYYGIFSFEIPFETTNRSYAGSISFDTELTYEEMRQRATGTAASGEYTYTSEIIEKDEEKRLLITAEHGRGTFYFAVMYSSDYDRYTIVWIKSREDIFPQTEAS